MEHHYRETSFLPNPSLIRRQSVFQNALLILLNETAVKKIHITKENFKNHVKVDLKGIELRMDV